MPEQPQNTCNAVTNAPDQLQSKKQAYASAIREQAKVLNLLAYEAKQMGLTVTFGLFEFKEAVKAEIEEIIPY